jgi:ABC-type amino acid transport substrate-binding protein
VVPDVRGLDEADAVASLLDMGLQPGDRFERASDRFPAGTVTRTDPPNGTTVPRRTVVDYYVSTGPTATQAPVTPPPTVVPTTPGDDQLGRIIAAGVLRVNVDPDDPPWSYAGAGGGRTGFDASVARAIAKRLGVEVEFTTFPLAEVVTGAWKDRFDIAISRLAITADRVGTLAFTRPYAYDPQQLAATVESGLVTIDELAGRAVCAPSLSVGLAWLSGTLALVEPPLEPAPPPPGATAFETADDADCAAIIAATGAPFDAWLASLPSQQLAIANKLPVTPLGNPVVWAPVGVAFDPLVPDGASLIATVDDIVRQLLEDGSLSRLSTRAFAGLDLTVVPKDGVVTAPQPSMTPIPL